jgi:DNA-binding MarR family transcriptional regulator
MPERGFELDPLIHAPVRLKVLTVLSEAADADFVHLRNQTGTTDGNLSRHLTKLEEAGYIRVRKGFAGKKPKTTCSLTAKGRRAFVAYLDELARIVESARAAGMEE